MTLATVCMKNTTTLDEILCAKSDRKSYGRASYSLTDRALKLGSASINPLGEGLMAILCYSSERADPGHEAGGPLHDNTYQQHPAKNTSKQHQNPLATHFLPYAMTDCRDKSLGQYPSHLLSKNVFPYQLATYNRCITSPTPTSLSRAVSIVAVSSSSASRCRGCVAGKPLNLR